MTDYDETLRQAVELHRAGDIAGAEQLYVSILQAGYHHVAAANLGVICAKRGDNARAEELYRLAIDHFPDFGEAYVNLANLLARQGRIDEAIENFHSALKTSNPPAKARKNLWQVLFEHNRNKEAVEELEQHTARYPRDVEPWNLLGLARVRMGRSAEAVPALKQAIALNPRHALAHNTLALALDASGDPDAAMEHLQTAIQLGPGRPEALSNLGLMKLEQGQAADAVACLRQSLALAPNQSFIHSNLLLALNYLPDVAPETMLDEHRRWAAAFADTLPPVGELHRPDAEGILHIGYVSSDFRGHPVGAYISGVLAAHDRTAVRVTCYSSVGKPDAITAELQRRSDGWRDILGLTDVAAAEQIRSDRVDLLVDLGGHTSRNRLGVFARRPAPIQATHFGYPNTTGMQAMSHRLTDTFADPEGFEARYAERLVRLPEMAWCWTPPDFVPDVGPLPADAGVPFVFGSLNNAAKQTEVVLDTWARIVASVPDSRLVMLGTTSQISRRRLLEFFGSRGLEGRIEILPRMKPREYYAAYNRIDLGLDPFPYNGGVTTCDSLWMGVPVVCLEGASYASRQGAAICRLLRMEGFIAQSVDEYVEIAVRLANDRERLRDIRAGSRERLQSSVLCDSVRFTRRLEAAYRDIVRGAAAGA